MKTLNNFFEKLHEDGLADATQKEFQVARILLDSSDEPISVLDELRLDLIVPILTTEKLNQLHIKNIIRVALILRGKLRKEKTEEIINAMQDSEQFSFMVEAVLNKLDGQMDKIEKLGGKDFLNTRIQMLAESPDPLIILKDEVKEARVRIENLLEGYNITYRRLLVATDMEEFLGPHTDKDRICNLGKKTYSSFLEVIKTKFEIRLPLSRSDRDEIMKA